MGLVETGELAVAPELIKEQWLYRVDVPFSIRRQVVRDYPVENLLSVVGQINSSESTVTPFQTD